VAIAAFAVVIATAVLNLVTHTDAPKANGWALVCLAVFGLLWSWLFVVPFGSRGGNARRAKALLWSWGYGLSVVYLCLLVTGLLIVIQGQNGPMT